jgi:hypothetical protein
MDKQQILAALEEPEIVERAISRRAASSRLGLVGAGLALASMPGALTVFARKAYAQGAGLPDPIQNALNFALVLEYLEADFYVMGLATPGLIPAVDRPIFEQIAKHEVAHVAFLRGVLGSEAARRPEWDFTAGGQFNTFGDYETFKVLAQGFEDTGVRAYKGQAGNLASNDDILTAALRIHSVEARHASMVRRLRGIKGWIVLDGVDSPAVLRQAGIYAGEANTVHLGIDTSKYLGMEPATEAFDEPLGLTEVLRIAGMFAKR